MKAAAALLVILLVQGAPVSGPPPEEVAAEHNNRGLALFADNRLDEAAKAFQEAVAATAGDAAAPRYNLALTFYRARRHEEALAALAAVPDSARSAVLRAKVLRVLGRNEEALRVWSEALRSGGLDVASRWHLVLLLRLAKRSEEAREVLTGLLRSVPERAVVEAELAATSAELGRVDEALAALRRAVAELGGGDAELAASVREAEDAARAGDAGRARTAVTESVNILRSAQDYVAGAKRFAVRSTDSPLSEEPLSLPSQAVPGDHSPPLKVEAEIAVEPARAMCRTSDGLLVVGDTRIVSLAPAGEGGWSTVESSPGRAVDCVLADLDQDGADDRVLIGPYGVEIVWAQGASVRLPGTAGSVTLLDHDLDGDADLVVTGSAGARLWRNNRDRTFSDVSQQSGLLAAAPGAALGAIAADLTGDGAAELYLLRGAGANLLLGGLQQERIATLGPLPEATGAAAALDCDHDGDLDLAAGGRLLLNDGRGSFSAQQLPPIAGAARLGAVDLDADGFLDVLALRDADLRVLRAVGACRFEAWPGGAWHGIEDVSVADFDRDGVWDLALLSQGKLQLVESSTAGRAVALELKGTKDTTDAVGAAVDAWAGRLRLHQQVRLGTHEIGAEGGGLLLGLGERKAAQWVRIAWPNNTWEGRDDVAAGRLAVEQSKDLVASCPFVYAWNGERFAFVTDLLGGSPLGLPLARNVSMPFDAEEYVLLAGDRLVAKDGRYDLRVTVELREMLFLDQVELLAVDHPAGSVIATDDGLRHPPFPPFHLFASASARAPVRATDHHGNDVLDRLLQVDGRYPDDFAWIPYQGYAEPHSLTLDFAELDHPEKAFLVVTGGYYWSEADNLALSQATAIQALPPRLEIWVDDGWSSLIEGMPFPGGRSKTIAVDLAGKLPRGPVRLRISTNLRLYFDQIHLAAQDLPPEAVRVERLSPIEAALAPHGYSEKGRFDGKLPPSYDYHRTVPGRRYKNIEGFYTRYGDITPLLDESDNASAILHHGDEVRIFFPALPPPPPTWVRDFLVYTSGWDKDAHPNTEAGAQVEPLPFHGMKSYPYSIPEHYPWTPELQEIHERYQTRWISRE